MNKLLQDKQEADVAVALCWALKEQLSEQKYRNYVDVILLDATRRSNETADAIKSLKRIGP